jgi:hypothetical protein
MERHSRPRVNWRGYGMLRQVGLRSPKLEIFNQRIVFDRLAKISMPITFRKDTCDPSYDPSCPSDPQAE